MPRVFWRLQFLRALTFHRGRTVTARSHESIINEVELLTELKNFKGYIHDVGGPDCKILDSLHARNNFREVCVKNKQCLFPQPCKNLVVDHSDYIELLRKLRKLPKIKKVFIRSGIRFDYLMSDKMIVFI